MPEFDLDDFKQTWQEQEVQPKYNSTEIESMLNKSSRNYVKYILWISAAEFIVILLMNLYYFFIGNDSKSFINILVKLGIKESADLDADFSHLNFGLKIVSLLFTAYFVIQFYRTYIKINVESNLKKLILQIIKFKKTVHLFILANIGLLILYAIILAIFTFWVLSKQHIELNNPTLITFYVGIIVMMMISILLIWAYYRLAYGIILKKLEKNLGELQKIEEEQN